MLLFFATLAIFEPVVRESPGLWHFWYLHGGGWEQTWVEAQLRTVPLTTDERRVFLVGSSMTREGFDVDYLNNEFQEGDTRFYSISSMAATPMDMFMTKDEMLARHPDVVVAEASVMALYYYNWPKLKYYFDPAVLPYVSRHLGITALFAQREYVLDSFVGYLSIIHKYDIAYLDSVGKAAKERLSGQHRTAPDLLQTLGQEAQPESYYEEAIRTSGGDLYRPSQYTALQKDLFSLFAEDVVSDGSRLIILGLPTHPLFKQLYKAEIDADFNTFFSDLASKIGCTYVSQEQLPSFTEADFLDFAHLNTFGRAKLSRFLEDYLLQNNLVQ